MNTETTTQKRALVVEEALRDHKGHWFEYNRDIVNGLRRQGYHVDVFVHRDVEADLRETLEATPVFRYSVWHGSYRGGIKAVFWHNWRVMGDLRAALRHREPYDLVFAGNNMIHHVLAWRVIMALNARQIRRLVLLFAVSPALPSPHPEQPQFAPKSFVYRGLLRAFSNLRNKGRVLFAAETPNTGRHIEVFAGGRVHALPHATDGVPQRAAAMASTHAPKCIGSMGVGRYEKGTELFQSAVKKLLEVPEFATIRFSYQWQNDFTKPDGTIARVDPELDAHARVEVMRTFRGGSDYWALLEGIDLMVLPYRLTTYATRLSRVAIEAMILGIPMVVTRGSWLEQAMAETGSGVSFEDENTDSLVAAIQEARQRYTELKELAVTRAPLARQHYSGETFARQLLEICKEVDAAC